MVDSGDRFPGREESNGTIRVNGPGQNFSDRIFTRGVKRGVICSAVSASPRRIGIAFKADRSFTW
jgi:hypothetical protein